MDLTIATDSAEGGAGTPKVWWYRDDRGQSTEYIELPFANDAKGSAPHAERLLDVKKGDVIVRFNPATATVIGLCRAEEDADGVTKDGEDWVRVSVHNWRANYPVGVDRVRTRLADLAEDGVEGWPVTRNGEWALGRFYKFSADALRLLVEAAGQQQWPGWVAAAAPPTRPANVGAGDALTLPNVWWMNDWETLDEPYRWTATERNDGKPRPDYGRMSKAEPGDVVVCYDSRTKAVVQLLLVKHKTLEQPRPDGYAANHPNASTPDKLGARLDVDRWRLPAPVPIAKLTAALAATRRVGTWPITEAGKVLQMTFLHFSRDGLGALRQLSEGGWPAWAQAILAAEARPGPVAQVEAPETSPSELLPTISVGLASAGLHYTPHQLAVFLTSLQTKGFVILSGISGTGKTKIAQHLASCMPHLASAGASNVPQDEVLVVRPYMLRNRFIALPKRFLEALPPIPNGWASDVTLRLGALRGEGRLANYETRSMPELNFKGASRDWLADHFSPGDTLILRPTLNDDGKVVAFDLGTPADFADPSAPKVTTPNHLFLPVRPDWRDSKPLLGYYNPLTESYVRTDFLDFLLRAEANWRSGEPIAWFVILDEMNLARVEYYFADLLSVLESGRDKEGRTCEALTFAVPDEADGWLPPRELRLPPNLYFVGTVNVDETTHAFSPKVLDRAFTIELSQADFADYPPTSGAAAELSDDVRNELLKQFRADGWPVIDKAMVREIVDKAPWLRDDLTELNARLGDDGLQFAYRVFDEVACFVWRAARNGMWAGDLRAAFDEAVLMKVLPKFHGSRARLEEPLRRVVAWCCEPELEQVSAVRYPRTLARAERLLRDVQRDGFAAF